MPRITQRPAGVEQPFASDRPAISRAKLGRHIAETRERWPQCRCELHAGLSVDELIALGSGCTAGREVCPRLAAVRRRCGL